MPLVAWILVVLLGAGLLSGAMTNAPQAASEGRIDPPLVTVRKPTPEELERLRERDERDRRAIQERGTR